MAAPNLVSPTTINGKTVTVNLTTTNDTSLLANASGTSKALKINSIYVANTTATAAAITVNYYTTNSISGTAIPIASAIIVPANATLVVVDKDAYVYLEEDRLIGVKAGTANALQVVCSYEDIS